MNINDDDDSSNKIVSNDGIISPATKTKTNNQRNSLTDIQMARKSKQHRRSCQGPNSYKQNEQQSPLMFSSSSTTTTTQHHPNYHSSNYQLKNTRQSQINDDDDDDYDHNDDEPNFDYDENEFDDVFDGANEIQPPRYSMLQQQQQQPLRNANRGI